jgi:hypothetical protein
LEPERHMLRKNDILKTLFAAVIFLTVSVCGAAASVQQATSAPKTVGTIKTVSGNTIALKTDTGTDVTIQVQDTTRLLRVAPGQDLKEASPITLQDIQAGDRILVRGKPGDPENALHASTIVAMKKGDIAQKQQKDLQDWQRRGIGGLVKAVDSSTGTITVSTMSAAGAKSVAVKLNPKTMIRRYAPDSVKFDDAKPGKLEEINAGDQLRARGNKNEDGTELVADEVVSGSFRNIAGLVASVDTAKNTVTVNDLSTKKPVTIRITEGSQMHKLPQPMAQRIAMRLKGGTPPEGAVAPAGQGGNQPAPQTQQHPMGAPGGSGGPGEAGARGNGDLAQMLTRMPVMQFSELAKGDAVMIVATSGSDKSDATAITLLSGVEPILTASPNGSGAASLLAPWSLGTGGAEAAAAGPQ